MDEAFVFRSRAVGRKLPPFVFVGILTSCGGTGGAAPTGVSASAIIGGVDSPGAHDFVMRIENLAQAEEGRVAQCSASLVAPNVLVTARHCVLAEISADGAVYCSPAGDPLDDAGTAPLVEPRRVAVLTGSANVIVAQAASVTAIFAPSTPSLCRDDIAFLVLDRNLDGVAKPVPMRTVRPTRAGDAVTAVGYGVSSPPSTKPAVRQEKSGLRVQDVGPTAAQADGTETTPRDEFTVAGNVYCNGDSGGPTLDDVTGALVGITSRRSDVGCRDPDGRGFLVAVAAYADLRDQAMAAAGATPTSEGDANPVLLATGAACTTDDECLARDCSPSQGICTPACDVDAPCPSGLVCRSDGTDGGSGGACEAVADAGGGDGAMESSSPGGGCSVVAGRQPGLPGWAGAALVFAIAAASRRRSSRPNRRSVRP
jgi:hypothetical protein